MSKPVPIPLPEHAPWMTQVLVLRALIAREMTTRFGKYRLGLFWMLLEPLLGVIVIGIIIGSLAARSVPEIPYPFFLLNGMLMLKLFTGPMNSAINALNANQGLLVYPSVKPLDPFLARFLFELITTGFSFVIFCVISMWIGMQISLGSLHELAAAYVLTWLTGCGFGLIFGVAAAYVEETEKIVSVLQRPLLFISAVLFPTAALPAATQELLFLNPLVHTIEISRHALFPYYRAEGANLAYPAAFAVIALAAGATLFHNHRNHLSSR